MKTPKPKTSRPQKAEGSKKESLHNQEPESRSQQKKQSQEETVKSKGYPIQKNGTSKNGNAYALGDDHFIENPLKPIPPFRRNKKHNSNEFDRQLKNQETAINKMTVKEWLENVFIFKTGDKKNYKKEAAESRKEFRENELDKRIDDYMENKNYSLEEARKQAQAEMKGQHVLHSPDGIAGGRANQISGLGDGRVNSSLGSQWKHGRAESLEMQLKLQYEIPPKSIRDIPDNAMMNVGLF